ncbi:MAG TPA: hypothetical protein VGA56_16725, partial [Opitutaceae bacterium]
MDVGVGQRVHKPLDIHHEVEGIAFDLVDHHRDSERRRIAPVRFLGGIDDRGEPDYSSVGRDK